MEKDDTPRVLTRPLPNAVTYDLSTHGSVTVTLPPSSTWTSGLHWHETHTEYLKVIQGSIRVRLGQSVQTVTATRDVQPEVKVDRNVWHEWQRDEMDGEDVIVMERTDPADDDKAVFFWNLNGVILNAPKILEDPTSPMSRLPSMFKGLALDLWITFNLFIIFHSLDNFPVFVNAPALVRASPGLRHTLSVAVDWIVSHLVLFSASWIGWALGIQPVHQAYTPPNVYASWWSKRGKSQKTA